MVNGLMEKEQQLRVNCMNIVLIDLATGKRHDV